MSRLARFEQGLEDDFQTDVAGGGDHRSCYCWVLALMIYYRGEPLARQTFDLVVNERVIVEIKTGENLHPDAHSQLFSYLCSSDIEVGLLLHFGHKPTFHRVICENRLKQRNGRDV